MALFEGIVCYLGALLTISLLVVYLYFQHIYSYWKKRGVPYTNPTFPLGNIGDAFLQRKQLAVVLADIYRELEGHKFGGFYQVHHPTLMLRDVDVIKSFLVKDFDHFQDRGVYYDEKNDPLSAHLFFIEGKKWKTLRGKLTPTFTPGKMKAMLQIFLDCGEILADCVEPLATDGDVIEVGDLIARYATDAIASYAFGIQCNCLQDPDAEFRRMGKAFFSRSFIGNWGMVLNFMAPSIAAVIKLGNTPKHLSDFFQRVVRETVTFRETNHVTRGDMMQLLIQLRNQGYVDGDATGKRDADTGVSTRLTMDEMAAQAFVIFLGGFETSASTLTFCLARLAANQDNQTRLRKEMRQVLARHDGKITYEATQEMPYLDMVIAETLRMHPVLPYLNRVCTETYRLDDSDLVVDKGTMVVVPLYAIHYDPQYYPEPDKFDPERFTPEMKAQRNPYAYLPFGEGPRFCIGMRFAMLQMKVGLIYMLRTYRFLVCDKTSVPPEVHPQIFFMIPKGDVYLRVVKAECD